MKDLLRDFVLWYLRKAAMLQIQKISPLVIGVGGSSGKTSLVKLLGNMFSDHFKVRFTKGENSEIGVPLHILGLAVEDNSFFDWVRILLTIPVQLVTQWQRQDVSIIEMGIDSPEEPKNMSYLLKIIQPKIAVVTNISIEHSVYFDPYVRDRNEDIRKQKILELTAKEENLLLHSLPKDGVAVVNIDDPYIRKNAFKIRAKQITISTNDSSATLFAKEVTIHPDAFIMEIIYKGNAYPLVIMQPLPVHFAYEFLCALGVSLAAGLAIQEAIVSLQQHFTLPAGRANVFRGIRSSVIIDSSYNNATLPPIMDMLDFLRMLGFGKRKLAIIGDMRELGSLSKEMHQEVAYKITQTANKAILIGPLMRNYAVPILKKAKFPYQQFDTFTQAKEAIIAAVKEKDVILVKGSQNTLFLERVVEMLLAQEEDAAKLCRRGSFWDNIREVTP